MLAPGVHESAMSRTKMDFVLTSVPLSAVYALRSVRTMGVYQDIDSAEHTPTQYQGNYANNFMPFKPFIR